MKNVLITGSKGFIGRNLKFRLIESGFRVLEFDSGDKFEDLSKEFKSINYIFHLAGVNRPDNNQEFYKGNNDLTKQLTDFLLKNKLNIPIVFSSSIQVNNNESDYAKSKKLAEEAIVEYAESAKAKIFIYRLHNVFGKWSRPNYNSFVATFCHNISRDLPIKIDDKDAKVDLVYIDDVVEEFVSLMDSGKSGKGYYYDMGNVYHTTVGEVAQKLNFFHETRENKYVGRVGMGLDRALYATYLSFLDKDNFAYEISAHTDDRGAFMEVIKTMDSGQFSVLRINEKDVVRGEHYHHTKSEKFLIVKGEALFRFVNMLNDDYVEYKINENDNKVIETSPGWAHSIENVGQGELISLIWANEVFDKEKEDTIKHKINKS